jgi:hypothetical protein
MRNPLFSATLVALVLVPASVFAEAEAPAPAPAAVPAPAAAPAPDKKKEEPSPWSASGELGMILTTGNAENISASASFTLGHKVKKNKLELTTSGAYARSGTRVAFDRNGNGTIGRDELITENRTTAEAIEGKLRYDRFLSEKQSLYLAALARHDVPAGKDLAGGGQLGYSRQLHRTEHHEVVAELGYDVSYEDPVGDADANTIHSMRGFLGFKGKLGAGNSFETSAEVLVNLNSLESPLGEIKAGDDTRVNGRAAWISKASKDLSLSFSVDFKLDAAPAPLVIPGATFDPGFMISAATLDTLFKASLIYSFF